MNGIKNLALALSACASLLACGAEDDGKTRGNIAKAFENAADPEANARKASEDMKRLKERAAAQQEEAVRAAIDAVTVAPSDTAGTPLKAACAGMRAAQDDFVQRRVAHDTTELERWNVFKPMELDKAEAECLDRKSVPVALCQRHAFENASREVTRSRIPEVLNRCIDKYGGQLSAIVPGDLGRAPS